MIKRIVAKRLLTFFKVLACLILFLAIIMALGVGLNLMIPSTEGKALAGVLLWCVSIAAFVASQVKTEQE